MAKSKARPKEPNARAQPSASAAPKPRPRKAAGNAKLDPAPPPAAPDPELKPARKGREKAPLDLGAALLGAWATHERIHHYLLEHLDSAAWAEPAPIGKGRTIRGVVAHLHNVRLLWLANSAPDVTAPAKADRETLTLDEARAALRASGAAMAELLRSALAGGGRVPNFKPDVAGFLAYAIAHEAHHRGQICMLARALGKPLPAQAGFGMWEWRKRHAETLPPEPES